MYVSEQLGLKVLALLDNAGGCGDSGGKTIDSAFMFGAMEAAGSNGC